jgi:hypothetical protein
MYTTLSTAPRAALPGVTAKATGLYVRAAGLLVDMSFVTLFLTLV